jgi:hypothetical protein
MHELHHASIDLLAPILSMQQLRSVLFFWAEGRVQWAYRGHRAQLQHAASILGLACWAAAQLRLLLPRA